MRFAKFLSSLCLTAGVLAAIAAMSPASADVRVEVENAPYQLRGLTTKAIDEDLHRSGMKEQDNIIAGEISDQVSWMFNLAETSGSCRVTSNTVLLKLNVVMPVWVDENQAPQDVRDTWKTYYTDLKAHEDGHKSIAIDAANRIGKVIDGATAPGSCADLKASLESTAQQLVQTMEQSQSRFDETDKTEFGFQ